MADVPGSIDTTLELLSSGDYVTGRSLATAVFLALKMQRPLFLEGEAGVGKTEIAKVLAQTLGRRLIRLSVTKAWTWHRRSTNGTTRGR